jgi:hypothetical protein
MLVIHLEAKGIDKVQPHLGGPAKAGDVPGVGWYFRLEKDYMKVGIINNPMFYLRNVAWHVDGSN